VRGRGRLSLRRWTLVAGAVLVVAVLLASALTAFGDTTSVSTFTKSGNDPTTNSTATGGGSPGSTKAGDTINWVLHYKNNTGASANVNITDPITGNQTYVPGSLQTPPGFSPQWSTDGGSSYVTSEPASGVNAVGAAGSSLPGSTGDTAQLGTPPAAVPASGSGDGWEPLFIGGNVYNVFHSGNLTPLDCHSVATGVRCPGYPTYASPTAGDPLGTGPHTPTTPSLFSDQFESADVVGTRIYYPVGQNTTSKFGVACADVVARVSCGFTPLGTGTVAFGVGIQGGAVIGSRYYLIDRNAAIDCFDTSTGAPCSGGPITGADPGAPSAGFGSYNNVQAWDNRYIFGNYARNGGGQDLLCVDLANNGANCPGFPKTS
jgi:hypothetical protein